MKKFITFTNFMVFLGILTILFYLIPAIEITARGQSASTTVNLFVATFGGSFLISNVQSLSAQPLVACGGLITAFFLGVVGIVCSLLKNKYRLANLLAFPFYTAAGALVCCGATMVSYVNDNAIISPIFNYSLYGGAITVAVFWLILAFFALVDFIATVAKPRQPQNPAY